MKTSQIVIAFLIFITVSCSNSHQPVYLDSWDGTYGFEETPIKANAGYSMIMDWTLSIHTKDKTNQGVLEVSGQQTYIKSKIRVTGDTNNIAILYDSLIDGSEQKRERGDTLFLLSKNAGSLTTKWFAMEPRLPENPPRECICFVRE